jgi:hypothetical protein
MPPLLELGPARRRQESAHASEAESLEKAWRRSWRMVFGQCIALALLGYTAFGLSWGLRGDGAAVLAAGSLVVGYVLPLCRLLAFFLRHADQF